MKAFVKRPGFVEGAGVALAAALASSAIMLVFAGIVAGPLLLSALVAALGLGYVLYLLVRSNTRVGKVSTMLVWALVTGVTLALNPPLLVHLCTQVGLVWLLRAFCVHRSVLPALADLVLCTLSVAVAVWAAERTGSVFMVIWCLLLVQAAYVAIPRRHRAVAHSQPSRSSDDERFAQAHRMADVALRRLSSNP